MTIHDPGEVMKSRLLAAVLTATCLMGVSQAQVPKDQLLKPPADAREFVIVSAAGQHGSSSLWRKIGRAHV